MSSSRRRGRLAKGRLGKRVLEGKSDTRLANQRRGVAIPETGGDTVNRGKEKGKKSYGKKDHTCIRKKTLITSTSKVQPKQAKGVKKEPKGQAVS